MAGDKPVILAAVTGAHGITGEVRIKLFGEDVSMLDRHRAFNDGALTLSKWRHDGKGGVIARFAEIADRNGAENLRGTQLTIPRSSLPPLAEDEYYHIDLIGLPVVSSKGDALGQCIAVHNFGAGDILEIERASGSRFMVPMRVEAVPTWDRNSITVSAAYADV